jgi:hypothetical protein
VRAKKGEEMTTESNLTEQKNQKNEVRIQSSSSDAVYGLGLIGAWVYYIGRATTNQERIQGFFKGLVWPAFLVYELLEFLHKE